VVAGLYSRRPGTPEALAAIGAGVSALLVARVASLGGSSWTVDPTVVGLGASAVAFAVTFIMRQRVRGT